MNIPMSEGEAFAKKLLTFLEESSANVSPLQIVRVNNQGIQNRSLPFISVRMRSMPFPGAGDNFSQVRVLGLPSKLIVDLL